MSGIIFFVAFIVVLFFLFIIGVPVAYSLGFTSLVIMFTEIAGIGINEELFTMRIFGGLNSFTLLAVPFFMFAGRVMNVGGMTERIFDFAGALVGRFKGGLAHINILASMIFSGMSGSATADVAGLGAIEYKAMKDGGYSDEISLGITGASSLIGPLIPPSIPAVYYAIIAEVSVGGILLAGLLPGIVVGIVLMIMSAIYAHIYNLPRGEKTSLKRIGRSFKRGGLALGTPILLLGGIISGNFTPTEAAAIAVVYALIVSVFIYKQYSLAELWKTLKGTMLDSATVLLLIGFANIYGFLIVRSRLPMIFTEQITSLTENPILILFIINVMLLIVGMFLDNLVAISILTPILLPLIETIGIHPVHFGVMMVFNLLIGLLTPPFGNVLFVLNKATGVSIGTIIRGVLLYIVPLIIALLLITYIPSITMWLPSLVFNI